MVNCESETFVIKESSERIITKISPHRAIPPAQVLEETSQG